MSESLINGTDILFSCLANAFHLMITHGITCEKFNKSFLVPIPKDKRKSLNDSNNYRAIALSSIICKVLEYIILDRMNTISTSDLQCGFKKDYSTVLCSFLVSESLQYYVNNSSTVYTLFLDASKAFDRINHITLFNRLIDRGICPLIIRIIAMMYNVGTAAIKWNDCISDTFRMKNGVKQGSVLSPFLFALYLDPLLDSISMSKFGCYIGDLPANVFSYADDVVVLTPSLTSLKHLIKL